jgi:hypothetical protein
MPGFLVHVNAKIMCPHSGQISVVTTNTRVFVSGQPVVTQTDMYSVTGCPISNPCVVAVWIAPATRILVNGQPVILNTSVGICQAGDMTPQGPPNVTSTQPRVSGA